MLVERVEDGATENVRSETLLSVLVLEGLLPSWRARASSTRLRGQSGRRQKRSRR
jgi:hypothetical protein